MLPSEPALILIIQRKDVDVHAVIFRHCSANCCCCCTAHRRFVSALMSTTESDCAAHGMEATPVPGARASPSAGYVLMLLPVITSKVWTVTCLADIANLLHRPDMTVHSVEMACRQQPSAVS
jgi:hypothetical protein